MEARNLAPLPADVDHITAAALPMPGLTAWQALFDHAHLQTGQTVLIHGAGGSVGSVAVQLAREAGAHIIGTGRTSDRDLAGAQGAHEFLDLDSDQLEDAGEVDVVFDVIGGEIRDRSTALVRPGGTLVTVADPPTVQPRGGRAIFFVVEPNREQSAQLAARLRDGRLTPLVTAVRDLAAGPRRVRRAHARQDHHHDEMTGFVGTPGIEDRAPIRYARTLQRTRGRDPRHPQHPAPPPLRAAGSYRRSSSWPVRRDRVSCPVKIEEPHYWRAISQMHR